MAFYKQAPGRKQKVSYGDLGSWDEEGTHYSSNAQGKKDSGHRSDSRKSGSDELRSNEKKASYRGRERKSINPSRSSMEHQGKRNGPYSDSRSSFEKRNSFRDSAKKSERSSFHNENRYGTERISRSDETADFRDYEYRAHDIIPAEEEKSNILCGRNPIREALKGDRDIEKLLVQRGELSGSAREIVAIAKAKKIMVQEVEKSRLDEIALHHQGLIAFASAYSYAEVDDILREADIRKEEPFIILLDSVTDPHNLGAIIRTAECVGAHGVIVPLHRSVGLTPAAVKASAGAIEHMHVARVTNLNRTIEELKSRGIWVYAVTMDGQDYESTDFSGGTALVIGAEGEGISRLTLEKCDKKVSLPMKGTLDSLNASVAAGVMMYRVLSSRKH